MVEQPRERVRLPVLRQQTESVVSIPGIYFNGFANNLGDSDISSLLLLDGTPVAKLNMSFTTAKTFARYLSELVGTLESVTTHKIMISPEVAEGLQNRVNKS